MIWITKSADIAMLTIPKMLAVDYALLAALDPLVLPVLSAGVVPLSLEL